MSLGTIEKLCAKLEFDPFSRSVKVMELTAFPLSLKNVQAGKNEAMRSLFLYSALSSLIAFSWFDKWASFAFLVRSISLVRHKIAAPRSRRCAGIFIRG